MSDSSVQLRGSSWVLARPSPLPKLFTDEEVTILNRTDINTEEKLQRLNTSPDYVEYAALCDKYAVQLPRIALCSRQLDKVRDMVITFAYTELLVPLGLVESVLKIERGNVNSWFPVDCEGPQTPQTMQLSRDVLFDQFDQCTEGERETLFWNIVTVLMKWKESGPTPGMLQTNKTRFKTALQLKHHEIHSTDDDVQKAVSIIHRYSAIMSVARQGSFVYTHLFELALMQQTVYGIIVVAERGM